MYFSKLGKKIKTRQFSLKYMTQWEAYCFLVFAKLFIILYIQDIWKLQCVAQEIYGLSYRRWIRFYLSQSFALSNYHVFSKEQPPSAEWLYAYRLMLPRTGNQIWMSHHTIIVSLKLKYNPVLNPLTVRDLIRRL